MRSRSSIRNGDATGPGARPPTASPRCGRSTGADDPKLPPTRSGRRSANLIVEGSPTMTVDDGVAKRRATTTITTGTAITIRMIRSSGPPGIRRNVAGSTQALARVTDSVGRHGYSVPPIRWFGSQAAGLQGSSRDGHRPVEAVHGEARHEPRRDRDRPRRRSRRRRRSTTSCSSRSTTTTTV